MTLSQAIDYPPAVLLAVIQHVEGTYPFEGCGAIVYSDRRLIARPMTNSLAETPGPRSGRTGYSFNLKEQLEVFQSGEVAALFHSHVDQPPDLSPEDCAQALHQGRPLFPGVEHLVISVVDGRATEAAAFRWISESFQGFPLRLPTRSSA
jgi:proteasome lid subunit RPN8/RPN11